jgi:predicted phosphoribosyltransferase
MGAVASGGVRVINSSLVRALRIPGAAIEAATAAEQRELQRRERRYRPGRPRLDVRGLSVILVDDGLATGATMEAAVRVLRQQEPAAIVVAVPVAAPTTCAALAATADACVCLRRPAALHAIGLWYEDFGQTGDDEVCALLDQAATAA